MAKIMFAALVDEIIGKLGGSVFQYSQGGYQVHVLGKPRNPQTTYQQLRRGDFGFLSSSWRNLTSIQRQTFTDNKPASISSLDFFIRTNVNLALINEPQVTTFTPGAIPTDMPVSIEAADPFNLVIKASGATTIVPAGTKLLVYSTFEKSPTKIFTNPSEYSPIIDIDAGTNLSIPFNIIAEFNNRYGQLKGDEYLCIKTVLINKTNGTRGAESIICSNTDTMPSKYIPLFTQLAQILKNTYVTNTLLRYTIPANTLVSNGDRIKCHAWGSRAGGGNSIAFLPVALNDTSLEFDAGDEGAWNMEIEVTRRGANTATYVVQITLDGANTRAGEVELAGRNFAAGLDIGIDVSMITPSTTTLDGMNVDYIKAP